MRRKDPRHSHRHLGTAPELEFAAALGALIGKALAERERMAAILMDPPIQGNSKRDPRQTIDRHRSSRHPRA